MLGAEFPLLPAQVAQEVKAFFNNLTSWLERALESGVKGGLIKLDSSVQAETATLVSVVHGAMLAARVYGNVALFKEVTEGAVGRLVKQRKSTRSASRTERMRRLSSVPDAVSRESQPPKVK